MHYSAQLFALAAFRPLHNWDEIPYTYLGSNNECSSKLHSAHYQYLEERIPALRNENSELLKSNKPSYRNRVLINYKYFCSNLPFYATKKVYIAFLRWLTTFTGDTLTSVRIASAVPGLLWYVALGLIVLAWLPGGVLAKAPILLILGQIGRSLAGLTTPDALSCLLITVSLAVILITSKWEQAKLINPVSITSLAILCAGVLAGLSIGIRSNMFIVVIASACGISPYIKRKFVVAFAGSAFIAYAIILKLLPDLLSAYPALILI